MIRMTATGLRYKPRVLHHFPAWGGIKELLHVRGGAATREEVLGMLRYCGHWNDDLQPNERYLNYAIREGWLVED